MVKGTVRRRQCIVHCRCRLGTALESPLQGRSRSKTPARMRPASEDARNKKIRKVGWRSSPNSSSYRARQRWNDRPSSMFRRRGGRRAEKAPGASLRQLRPKGFWVKGIAIPAKTTVAWVRDIPLSPEGSDRSETGVVPSAKSMVEWAKIAMSQANGFRDTLASGVHLPKPDPPVSFYEKAMCNYRHTLQPKLKLLG